MSIENLRYSLTEHMKRVLFTYENFKLLVIPEFFYLDLIRQIDDDIELMPDILNTIDDCEIKFYKYDYNEKVFLKSELLAFIFASINDCFDICKCFDINSGKYHYCLKNGDVIYDPSLAVVTNDELYFKRFKLIKVIKNEEVTNYLKENNNLYKFYNKGLFNKDSNFSIKFINAFYHYSTLFTLLCLLLM